MQRIDYLDNVKWILTLMIVLFHIQFFGDESYRYSFLLIKNMGDCVVPAFAIISGVLFYRNVRNYSDIPRKIKTRIWSLLVPYLLWNILNSICLGLVELEWDSIYKYIVLWYATPHFWYIFMLIFWTVLSPILLWFYSSKLKFVLLLFIELSYIFIQGDDILHSRFIYILYTWAGFIGYIKLDLFSLAQRLRKKYTNINICVIAWCVYFLIYGIYSLFDINMSVRVWLYAIRAIVLIIALANLPTDWRIYKYMEYSFWVFAVHLWLDHYLCVYVLKYVHNPMLYQLTTWCFVMFVAMSTGYLLKRKLPSVFNILTGSRTYK